MPKCEFVNLPCMEDERKVIKEYRVIKDNYSFSNKLKEFAKGKKYFVKTYGCQANVRDSEIMSGYLENIGFLRTNSELDADVIIVNTCAVRENAEDKVFGEIGNLKSAKLKNKNVIIGLCGCMVQQRHIIDFVIEKFPHVNLIFGTNNVTKLPDYLEKLIRSKIRLIDVTSSSDEIHEELPSVRDDKHKAFVNIMYGCNKFCTYCIVPYTRGRERSRLESDILKECQDLINQGYKEITLLGQNVNSYGKDLKNGSSFAKLLEDVAKLGIERLRFTTSHPWDFDQDMINVIAKYPNIMKFIHLPVQSGNDNILRLMGRRYNREKYLELVRKIRETIPDVSLSTDIIVGFPNETYEEFLDTVSLVKEVEYDSAFSFIYSPRKGTPAAKIEDNVSAKDKSKRFIELTTELEKIIEKKAAKMVGLTYKVLVDGCSKKDEKMLSGYTENNKLVHFEGDKTLIGNIVKVKIVESHTYSLIGELVNE